jgi:hypothetical protein
MRPADRNKTDTRLLATFMQVRIECQKFPWYSNIIITVGI